MMNYFAAERDTKKELDGDLYTALLRGATEARPTRKGGDYQSRVGPAERIHNSAFIKKMDDVLLTTTTRMDESLVY